MRIYNTYLGLVTLFLITQLWGCSSIQVSQDYDLSRDFSTLKTYAWQIESQPTTGDIRVDNSLLIPAYVQR